MWNKKSLFYSILFLGLLVASPKLSYAEPPHDDGGANKPSESGPSDTQKNEMDECMADMKKNIRAGGQIFSQGLHFAVARYLAMLEMTRMIPNMAKAPMCRINHAFKRAGYAGEALDRRRHPFFTVRLKVQ